MILRWFLCLSVGFLVPAVAAAQKTKPTKITVQLRGVLGDGSVKALKSALQKVPAVKFPAGSITKGKEPRFFSDPFVIEIADLKKTDIGAIAKAAVQAKTPVADDLTPGLNLMLYTLDPITERLIVEVRNSVADVPGVGAKDRGGVGALISESYIWIKIDGSGKAKISEILNAVKNAGVKVVLVNPV